MNMDCPVCFEQYGSDTDRPVVGACGHSICENCAPLGTSCPICRKNGAFRNKIPNFQLIDLINKNTEYLNNRLTIDSGDSLLEGYTKCALCDIKVSRKTIRLCLDCSFRDLSKPDKNIDPVISCASCCLEGAHAGHKTILHSPVHDELFKLHGSVELISQSKSNISELGVSIDTAKKRVVNIPMILAMIKSPSSDLSTFANVSEKFQKAVTELIDLEEMMRDVLGSFEALEKDWNNLTGNGRNSRSPLYEWFCSENEKLNDQERNAILRNFRRGPSPDTPQLFEEPAFCVSPTYTYPPAPPAQLGLPQTLRPRVPVKVPPKQMFKTRRRRREDKEEELLLFQQQQFRR